MSVLSYILHLSVSVFFLLFLPLIFLFKIHLQNPSLTHVLPPYLSFLLSFSPALKSSHSFVYFTCALLFHLSSLYALISTSLSFLLTVSPLLKKCPGFAASPSPWGQLPGK